MSEINIHEEIKRRLRGGEPDICGIDATPNDEYPVRILEAYLHRTEARWLRCDGCTDRLHQIYDAMNETQDKRAEIIRKAIACLKRDKE